MELLKIGQKLNIYFEKGDIIVEIACEISNIEEDRLTIDLPSYFMRYIEYLDVGCDLTVKVFSKVGTIDFNTVVISSPLEDDFTVEIDYNAIKLTPSSEIPVIKSMEKLSISMDDKVFNVSTFEVSTSFLSFYCDYEFQVGDKLDCVLSLPKDYGIIKFRGEISYVDPVYENEFKLSLFDLSENDKLSLLYYMYLYSNNSD